MLKLLLVVKHAESFLFRWETALLIGLLLVKLSLGCLKSDDMCF